MTITIAPDPDQHLNLSPAQTVIENLLQAIASYEQQLRFAINYPQEPGDPGTNPRGAAVVYLSGFPLSLVAIFAGLES